MPLSAISQQRLGEVHPDLARVIQEAAVEPPVAFQVSEGLRSTVRQAQLVRSGASQTMRSRHLTGHAVDLVAYVGRRVAWDWPLYERLAVHVKHAAEHLGVPIEWGGDWVSFKDGPHFQLPWKAYPA